jgi:hypothetical protein
MFCSKCGAKNDADDLFCYKCGARLKTAVSKEGESAAPEAAQVKIAADRSAPGPGPKKSHKGLVIGIAAAVVVVTAAVVGFKLLWQPAARQDAFASNAGPSGDAEAEPSAAEETAASDTSVLTDAGAGDEDEQAGETESVTSLGYGLMAGLYERDFSTPEEAIEHFVAAVAGNDFKEAMAACAVNEAADNFDAAAYIARLKVITYYMGAPSDYEFYRTLNRAYVLNQITNQLKYFTYSFFDSEAAKAICGGQNYALQDFEKDAAQFVADVDPAVLADLRILRMDLPYPETYNSENNEGNLLNFTATYGADEATDRIVLYELDGETYLGGFTLLRYGNSWKIISLSSAIGGISAYGAVSQITEEAYSGMVE